MGIDLQRWRIKVWVSEGGQCTCTHLSRAGPPAVAIRFCTCSLFLCRSPCRSYLCILEAAASVVLGFEACGVCLLVVYWLCFICPLYCLLESCELPYLYNDTHICIKGNIYWKKQWREILCTQIQSTNSNSMTKSNKTRLSLNSLITRSNFYQL